MLSCLFFHKVRITDQPATSFSVSQQRRFAHSCHSDVYPGGKALIPARRRNYLFWKRIACSADVDSLFFCSYSAGNERLSSLFNLFLRIGSFGAQQYAGEPFLRKILSKTVWKAPT
jgi:hypothetical protein